MANIESIIDKCCGVVTGAVALGLGVQSAGGILAATATGGLVARGVGARLLLPRFSAPAIRVNIPMRHSARWSVS